MADADLVVIARMPVLSHISLDHHGHRHGYGRLRRALVDSADDGAVTRARHREPYLPEILPTTCCRREPADVERGYGLPVTH